MTLFDIGEKKSEKYNQVLNNLIVQSMFYFNREMAFVAWSEYLKHRNTMQTGFKEYLELSLKICLL